MSINQTIILLLKFRQILHNLLTPLTKLLWIKIFIQLSGHIINLVVLLFLVILHQPDIIQFLDIFLEFIVLILFVLDLFSKFFFGLLDLLLELVVIIPNVYFLALYLILLLLLDFVHRFQTEFKCCDPSFNLKECLSLLFGYLFSWTDLLFHMVESLVWDVSAHLFAEMNKFVISVENLNDPLIDVFETFLEAKIREFY